jgi:hypothetical protein
MCGQLIAERMDSGNHLLVCTLSGRVRVRVLSPQVRVQPNMSPEPGTSPNLGFVEDFSRISVHVFEQVISHGTHSVERKESGGETVVVELHRNGVSDG